jgi:hypothetical protein
MYVQWYCPPAVGHILTSSDMVAVTAAHPIQHSRKPYIKPPGPPLSRPKMKTQKNPSQVIVKEHARPSPAVGEKLRWMRISVYG